MLYNVQTQVSSRHTEDEALVGISSEDEAEDMDLDLAILVKQ